MKKENLLTIGEMSKRTGASIKSIRYYTSMGLLKPEYVDPDSNYRYYSYEQVRIVEIIQLFIALDVPLKEVKQRAVDENGRMNYKNLIAYGRNLGKERILEIERNLRYLDIMESEIRRTDSYKNNEEKEFLMKEKYCYAVEYYENNIGDQFYADINDIFHKLLNNKLEIGYEYGLIMKRENTEIKKYVFIDLESGNRDMLKQKHILYLPARRYLCRKTNEFNLEQIREDFHADEKNRDYTMIVCPEYSYDFSNPYFEVRYFAQEDL